MQMKEYQVYLEVLKSDDHLLICHQTARKKLENRRLAYDTSLAKMQKAKKEDFRVEEELRSQKLKYEETSEDVYRRMQDVCHPQSTPKLVRSLSNLSLDQRGRG